MPRIAPHRGHDHSLHRAGTLSLWQFRHAPGAPNEAGITHAHAPGKCQANQSRPPPLSPHRLNLRYIKMAVHHDDDCMWCRAILVCTSARRLGFNVIYAARGGASLGVKRAEALPAVRSPREETAHVDDLEDCEGEELGVSEPHTEGTHDRPEDPRHREVCVHHRGVGVQNP